MAATTPSKELTNLQVGDVADKKDNKAKTISRRDFLRYVFAVGVGVGVVEATSSLWEPKVLSSIAKAAKRILPGGAEARVVTPDPVFEVEDGGQKLHILKYIQPPTPKLFLWGETSPYVIPNLEHRRDPNDPNTYDTHEITYRLGTNEDGDGIMLEHAFLAYHGQQTTYPWSDDEARTAGRIFLRAKRVNEELMVAGDAGPRDLRTKPLYFEKPIFGQRLIDPCCYAAGLCPDQKANLDFLLIPQGQLQFNDDSVGQGAHETNHHWNPMVDVEIVDFPSSKSGFHSAFVEGMAALADKKAVGRWRLINPSSRMNYDDLNRPELRDKSFSREDLQRHTTMAGMALEQAENSFPGTIRSIVKAVNKLTHSNEIVLDRSRTPIDSSVIVNAPNKIWSTRGNSFFEWLNGQHVFWMKA